MNAKYLCNLLLYFSLIYSICLWSCRDLNEKSKPKSVSKIDWKYQIDSLLMPFWMTEDAYGNPPGNFPNYRYNDGKIISYDNFDFSTIPQYLTEFLINQPDSLRRDFIRINSRQVYSYCVAYHITGNEKYLIRAKTGVGYLLKHGGYDSGSPYTFWQDGKGMPNKFQSTTQDLAYALTGLAMYYYLTRDAEILNQILKVKDFVIKEYYENSNVKYNTKLVAWVKKDFENDNKKSRRLLAVLDQLNAYLVLLTPILPDNLKDVFLQDIKTLAYSLKDNFYNTEHNLFWMDLDNKVIRDFQTDFGHSIKSFWMLYIIGNLSKDHELSQFAKENALKLLETAYLDESGSWAQRFIDSTMKIDKSKSWWSYAELDQMAATLSLNDTLLYTKYLKQTYRYWEEKFIDHKNKEVHFLLDEAGNPIDLGLKTCHWKNGFHSLEHALIGFLSTCNYNGEDINLYYAFNKNNFPEMTKLRPYYYDADVLSIEYDNPPDWPFKNRSRTKVTFGNIR